MSIHYPDPNELSGRSYCGDLVGRRVLRPVQMNGPIPPFINYHLTTCTEGRWSFQKGQWIPPKDIHKESTAAYVDTFRGARNIHSVICKACGLTKKTLPMIGNVE